MWMHLHWEAWEKQVKQAKEIGDVRHHHQQAVSWSVVLKTHQILMENWAFSLLRAQFISSFFAEHPGSHSFASSLLQIYLLELLKYSCRKPLVNPELGGNYASHQCWLRESSKPYNLLPADCAWSGLWSQQHLQRLNNRKIRTCVIYKTHCFTQQNWTKELIADNLSVQNLTYSSLWWNKSHQEDKNLNSMRDRQQSEIWPHLLKFRGSISKVGFKEILSGVCTVVKDKPFNHSRLSKSGPSALSHMGTKNVNNVSVDSNRKE
jgi:hypothetical protein